MEMETEKMEYDSTVGGPIELPDKINTFHFASRRLEEIKCLMQSIDNPTQTKLIFQTLPKHMRRRAMSHNPKRLPRKYRQAHISQMRKGGAGQSERTKRPSRKYRRKPSNLITEYLKRQQKMLWLETHIWHAKRFHMVERWSYKLADYSCNKTFRSSYRATSKFCLIQDISFMGCIQIVGQIDDLRLGFDRLRNQSGGLGICAKAFLNGAREGMVDLFRMDSYPNEPIGTVSFIWRPSNQKHRTLWMFVHPICYRNIISELIKLFQLTQMVEYQSKPTYYNSTTKIELIELKNHLNRFRLTGPLSHAVLQKSFKCKLIAPEGIVEKENWFDDYVNSGSGKHTHTIQTNYWNSLHSINSPAQLPISMILALNIEDPRINRPSKRSKALPIKPEEIISSAVTFTVPDQCSISSLWLSDIRDRLSSEKLSTKLYCDLRNKNAMVPGERCQFENNLQPIPVILIQRPGNQKTDFKKLGYGCGWDVIIPSNYGLSTWISLVMWGARPGGLRETKTVYRESGSVEFVPDTVAAKNWSDEVEVRLQEKYFRLPPNKRLNYKKLAIASPFKCPWQQLINEWSNGQNIGNNFTVLRDQMELHKLKVYLQDHKPISKTYIKDNTLIPIQISIEGRGIPRKFAVICIPKSSDIKRSLRNKISLCDRKPIFTEPIRPDEDESMRKQVRIEHKKLLKRLRRRRVRVKHAQQEQSNRRVIITKPGTAKLITEHFQKMCELWLPNKNVSIRNQCSREVIGYTTDGDFSFMEAKGTAIGYVTICGLQTLINTERKYGKFQTNYIKVLVRNTNSREYLLAKLYINV